MLQTLKQAFQMQKQGNLPEAERLYRQVLDQEVDNIHALNLLGVLCVNSDRSEEAIKLIKRALRIRPDDPQALANLALALKNTGRIDEAIGCLEQSLTLKADNAAALNSLGSLLLDSGKTEEAITQYKKALMLDQGFVDCLCNLASALNKVKQHEKALMSIQKALSLDPQKPQAHHNLADIYRAQSRFDEAIEHYNIALKLNPDYFEAMLNLARTYREAEKPETAKTILEQLVKLQPDNAEAFNALGLLQEQLGEPADAANYFKKSIAIAPGIANSHYQLAQIQGRKSTDDEISAIEELIVQKTINDQDKVLLSFALARGYEQKERFDDAFDAWAQGNAIKAKKSPYDNAGKNQFYQSLVKHASVALRFLGSSAGSADTQPLFVMGMPRSGNTLTGQILSSHSAISSLGELSFAHDIADKIEAMSGQKYPEGLERLALAHCKQLGDMFKTRVPEKYSDSTYVIDNTPLNFQHIGLLSLVLPKAKFILCHRDPIDTCFSMFKLPFGDNQSYAHGLISLAEHYNSYRVLMNSWQSLFPGRILEVSYEETVDDVERQARRMLDFLGLPFEQSVLNFHESKNLVRTPSTSQVRKPIYKEAVHAWKRYEKQLAPLIEALNSNT
jgi:tetratricopeptide (TPR) repeat protein